MSLTTNTGGMVTIDSVADTVVLDGVEIIGVSVEIDAPPGSPEDPLVITLRVDASAIPPGVDPTQFEMLRNQVPLDDCAGPAIADPDPCLTSLTVLPDGDIEIVGLTTHASLWQVAVRGQTSGEQKCTNLMNGAGFKVAKAQGKAGASCLKAASKGDEPDAQGCLTADVGGKVAKATGKTVTTEAGKCVPAPPFAFTGSAAVNAAAQSAAIGLVADVFGPDLTASALPKSDKEGSKCQAGVLKAVQKLFETKAKDFLKCKKSALQGKKAALAVSAPQLAQCFAGVDADPKGKIAKAVGKITSTLEKKCDEVNVPTVLPGACFGGVTPASCLDARTDCRYCRMFNAMDGLAEDCDRYDDGVANLSCP